MNPLLTTVRNLNFQDLFQAHAEEGRLFFNRRRAVIFDVEALGMLRQQLMETLGEELAMGILMRFGYAHGRNDAEMLGKDHAWETESDWLAAGPTLHILEGIVHVAPEKIEFDRATGHFHMLGIWRNSYEAEVHLRHWGGCDHPVCWTLAGYASGYASRFFGRELLAIETACAGQGDDCCRWEIRPVGLWGPEAVPYLKALKAVDVFSQLQQLHTTGTRYRDIALSNADWVWELDMKGRYTYCSRHIEDVLGYRPEEVLGRPIFQFMPREEANRTLGIFSRVVEAGQAITDLEFQSLAKDGREVFLLANGVPFQDGQGRLAGFRGASKDITARRVAEEELRELLKMHSLVLDNSMVGICFVRNRIFEWVNLRMAEIIGLVQDVFRGASTRLVYADDIDFARIGRTAYPAMARGERFDGEIRARRADGSIFWARILGKARDPGSPQEETIWVFEDITERKRAEEALVAQRAHLEEEIQRRTTDLQEVNARLHRTHELKNHFFGIVGHDLRNPLNSIVMSAQLLEDVQDSKEVARMACRIAEVGMEMGALLDRFLDINRLDSGQVKPELEIFSLGELIQAMVERHRTRATEKGIGLCVQAHEGSGEAYGDPKFMKGVLDNLISNAIKFSPSGTTVTLNLDLWEERALLSVVDQGPGLTEEDRSKLFGRFARLSARPTGGERSVGLGLSIVKYMVDAMGGCIWVKSEPGKGAAFCVDLPRRPDLLQTSGRGATQKPTPSDSTQAN